MEHGATASDVTFGMGKQQMNGSAGKTVLVTGGTGGLGQAVVRALVQAGHNAAVVYLEPAKWTKLLEALGGETDRVLGLQGDALSPDFMETAVQETTSRFGGLDGLFHLIGGFASASLEDTPLELWWHMMLLNLESAYVAARAVLPPLLRSRGCMVFVGAQAVSKASANQSAYNASKAGVMALARTLANELRPRGVRVNAVVPDTIDTAANRQSMPRADFQRWLTPDQVAEVFLYLLSPASSAMDGATIVLQRSEPAG
jgi:NAD(P)-dependent dehydrogenase (short-subunit alcohol dehydrogenase family)